MMTGGKGCTSIEQIWRQCICNSPRCAVVVSNFIPWQSLEIQQKSGAFSARCISKVARNGHHLVFPLCDEVHLPVDHLSLDLLRKTAIQSGCQQLTRST
jgi:hypothetical protein